MIHIYCGEGKGKTTAAVGLAIRAAGVGRKIIIAQFLKGQYSSEEKILQGISNIRLLKSKNFPKFLSAMSESEKAELRRSHNEFLAIIAEQIRIGACDMVILDEIAAAYNYNAVDCELADKIIETAEGRIELVLTGRNPPDKWVEAADYVTEMKKVKHPFDKGIKARVGIER